MKKLSYEHKLNLHDFKEKALEEKTNIRWFDVWDSVFLQSMSFLVTRENGAFEVFKFTTKTSSTFSRLIKWLEENSFDFRVAR